MGQTIFLKEKTDEFTKALNDVLVFSSEESSAIEEDQEKSNEFQSLMKELITSLADMKSEFIPYSEISQTVFALVRSNGYDADSMEFTITRMGDYIVELFDNADPVLENIEVKLTKMMSNIKLAKTQVNFLYDTQNTDIQNLIDKMDKAEANVKTLDDTLSEIEKKFNESVEEKADTLSNKMDEKVDKMYSSFVSVLGIFVAISFSLFGAVSLLNHLFNISSEILNSPKASTGIGVAIMLSGISMILIYLLLVGLLSGIGYVIDKKFTANLWLMKLVIFVSIVLSIIGFFYPYILKFFHL